MNGSTWWATCEHTNENPPVPVAVGRRSALACAECNALYCEVPHVVEDAIRATVPGNTAEVERMRAALVRLSTEIFYSARDTTGEASTRRVQMVAAQGLRGMK